MNDELPKITAAMLKEAGLNSWVQEFMGVIGRKFTERGYTFEQFRQAVWDFCYYSDAGGGLMVRLRPQFDPQAIPCPVHNDPEIVMQPGSDRLWHCPKCGHVLTGDLAAL